MIQEKNILKSYFETGDKPTQSQYENLIDSLRHVYDDIPIGDIDGEILTQTELNEALTNVAKTNEKNTFSMNQVLGNNTELRWKDSNGTERTILELDNDNTLYIGGSHSGGTSFVGGGSYTTVGSITANGKWQFLTDSLFNKQVDINEGLVVKGRTSDTSAYSLISKSADDNILFSIRNEGRIDSNGPFYSYGALYAYNSMSIYSGALQFMNGDTDYQFYASGDNFYLRDITNSVDLARFNPNEVEFTRPVEITTIDSNRYVKFKAPNGESRFDFYTGGTGNPAHLDLYDSDGTTVKTRIRSVGTSFFGGDLSIVNASANAALNFNTSVGNARSFSMYNNGSNLYTKLMTNVGASFIWEAYDGTNVFSISSTGNIVTAGTATFGGDLTVEGTTRFNDNTRVDANLTVGGLDNTGQPVTFYQKDDNTYNGWYVGYTGPAGNEFGIYGYETDGQFKIFTNNTLGLEIDENQAIQTHGNLTINQGAFSAYANSGARHLMYSDTADAPLKVQSGDSATGIAFQDNNGTSHIFYWGSGDYYQSESDWWVAGDIKSRGGDIYAGRFGSNPVDSGSYYLLEHVDTTWGTDANGFRLHLNGDSNDFSLEAASDTTTDTIFSVDRGTSGDFILQRDVVMKNNLTVEGSNVDMHGMLEFSQDNGAKIRLNRTGYHQYTIQQSAGAGLSFYDNDHGDESLYLYGDSAVVNGSTNGGYNFKVNGTANITSNLDVDGSIIIGGLVDNSVFPAPPALAPAFQISHNTTSEEVEISAAHGVITLQDETRTDLSTSQIDSANDKVLVSKEWVVQYVASQLT